MKNKFNTLHKYIFDYSDKEYTKETVNGLFGAVLKPLLAFPEAESCILAKLNDFENKTSILTRLEYSNHKIYGFCSELGKFNIENFSKDNIWKTTQFTVVLAHRYSAALVWDYSISENDKYAKTCLLFNSKIVNEIAKKILENSKTDYKPILSKFNADRRENKMLNNAAANIASILNDKNEEILCIQEENRYSLSGDDTFKTAEIVADKAKFIAHEIKNNLSVINLYSTIVEKRFDKAVSDEEISQAAANAIKNIKNASENISSLISDLRCLSAPYISETEMKTFIKNTVELCEEKARLSGVEISASDIKEQVLLTDKTKLRYVLINIIYNAIEACNSGNKVEIYSEIDDNFYDIFVKNNGEKISDKIQNKIFDMEFTTKTQGSGLGLSICKKYLERTGGNIYLVSSDKKATVFKIELKLS